METESKDELTGKVHSLIEEYGLQPVIRACADYCFEVHKGWGPDNPLGDTWNEHYRILSRAAKAIKENK